MNGLPKECANIIALVFGLIAASIFVTSILCVAISTSTNTGTAPNCKIGLTEVKEKVKFYSRYELALGIAMGAIKAF